MSDQLNVNVETTPTAGPNATFDWDQVKAKLALAMDTDTENPKKIETIYQQRAERYATRDLVNKEESQARWLMAPFLEGRVAIPLISISDIMHSCSVTEAPGGPEELVGFISYQGEIIPILDPWVLVGKSRPPGKGDGFFVLLRRGLDRLGLLVTRIDALEKIPEYTEMGWSQCPELNAYFRAWGADGILILNAEALIQAYL